MTTATTFTSRIDTATAIAAEINTEANYHAKVWHRESTNDVRVYVHAADGSTQYGSVTVHRNGKVYTNTKRYSGDIRRLVEHVAQVSV